ncbi:MAG: hypothetical protein WA160_06915 [Pseudobdellovibrio sp.]
MKSKIFLYALSILVFSSCSSLNFKEKTFRNMAVATAVGILLGQQEKENKGSFSLIYAGLGSSLTAVGSIIAYDPDKEIEKTSGVSKEVANSLEMTISNNSSSLNKYKKGESLTNFSTMPSKYKNLIKPGEWKISQISEWEQIDDYTLVHKTELFEIKPPEINIK